MFHLNTHVMDLRPLEIIYSFSAGINLRRHNLTSVIMTSKFGPVLKTYCANILRQLGILDGFIIVIRQCPLCTLVVDLPRP